MSDVGLSADEPVFVLYTGQDVDTIPRNVTHLIVASSVATIEAYCFFQCRRLTSVEFQEGLQVIGENAFGFCTSMKRLRFPSSLRVIGNSAFTRCTGLQVAELNEGLEVLLSHSFSCCTSLTNFRIPATVRGIEPGLFSNCAQLYSVELPDRLRVIHGLAFEDCSSLRLIVVPPTAMEVGEDHFLGCDRLQEVMSNDCLVDDSFDRLERFKILMKHRVENLPIHKLCYHHSYHSMTETIEALRQVAHSVKCNPTDAFGMTPFHILALCAKPNFHIFSSLLELYPLDVLYQTDMWGNPAIHYLCQNNETEAVSLLKYLVQLTILDRLKLLGLESWRKEIVAQVETFYKADVLKRSEQIGFIYEALDKYERLELTTQLELTLWKAKITVEKIEARLRINPVVIQRRRKKARTEDPPKLQHAVTIDRHLCRVNCGADAVISNIIPFLGPLYEVGRPRR